MAGNAKLSEATALWTLCFRDVLRLFLKKGNRSRNEWECSKRMNEMSNDRAQLPRRWPYLRDWERYTTPQQGCRWMSLRHNHKESIGPWKIQNLRNVISSHPLDAIFSAYHGICPYLLFFLFLPCWGSGLKVESLILVFSTRLSPSSPGISLIVSRIWKAMKIQEF